MEKPLVELRNFTLLCQDFKKERTYSIHTTHACTPTINAPHTRTHAYTHAHTHHTHTRAPCACACHRMLLKNPLQLHTQTNLCTHPCICANTHRHQWHIYRTQTSTYTGPKQAHTQAPKQAHTQAPKKQRILLSKPPLSLSDLSQISASPFMTRAGGEVP